MTSTASRVPCEVRASGELAVLALGNFSVSLTFDTAIKCGAALLTHGRLARRIAGHTGRALRVGGSLVNLETAKPSRFASKLPPLETNVAVRNVGALVELKLGTTTAGMGWNEALTLAQWLRVRGKEARNQAGERAHWATFGHAALVAP